MKTRSFIFLLIVCVPFLFQSCSVPQNLVKLQPFDESTKWLYGQAFARDSINGIIYEAGFDQVVETTYLFDFDITNRSNLDILINPADFYYIPLNDSLQPMGKEFHANDPEEEILDIEKRLSVTEARRKSNLALSLLGLGVDITTAAITASDDNPHNDFLRTDMFDAVQAGNIANEFESTDLKQLRDSWMKSTIRKTTLAPGYSMKGKVFFPVFPGAKYIELMLPVDDQCIKILFQQKYIPVQ